MKTIDYYLDKAKKNNDFKSDLALNRALGFKGSMVSNLRLGKTHISDEKMMELAILAGENPHEALLHLNEWRSPDTVKKVYAAILQNLSRAAMLSIYGIVVLCSLYGNSANAHPAKKCQQDNNRIYIMEYKSFALKLKRYFKTLLLRLFLPLCGKAVNP